METHTPTLPERLTTIREKLRLRLEAEGARYGVARAVDLLILELMAWMISLAISRAERSVEICRDVVPGGFDAASGVGGADRRGDAGTPDAGERIAVRAVVAAADVAVVIDGVTDGDCILNEGGALAAFGRPPRGRRDLVATAQGGFGLDCGRSVLDGFFAKMGLMKWVELRRFCC